MWSRIVQSFYMYLCEASIHSKVSVLSKTSYCLCCTYVCICYANVEYSEERWTAVMVRVCRGCMSVCRMMVFFVSSQLNKMAANGGEIDEGLYSRQL